MVPLQLKDPLELIVKRSDFSLFHVMSRHAMTFSG